jgi:hypothetical protein
LGEDRLCRSAHHVRASDHRLYCCGKDARDVMDSSPVC